MLGNNEGPACCVMTLLKPSKLDETWSQILAIFTASTEAVGALLVVIV